jgi:putative Mg2+ transporter-C (MgtC) family protein
LGALIGWEREQVGKEAGIRTFALISTGACLFSVVSQAIPFGDPTRIASNVVVGIGFLGGGLIFHDKSQARGLTTAASLWVSAAVGLSVGFDLYLLALLSTLLIIIILHIPTANVWKYLSKKKKERLS